MKIISIEELGMAIKNMNCQIVDLRDNIEYRQWHLKGAINIPFEELEKDKWRLKKNRKVIFYCMRGRHSIKAAGELESLGYDAYAVVVPANVLKAKFYTQ